MQTFIFFLIKKKPKNMLQRTSYIDLYGCERFIDAREWVFFHVTKETAPLFSPSTAPS